MQIAIEVLKPAPDHSLVSLYDAKTALNIKQSDSSKDEQIALFIKWASAEVEALCNRIFARERVVETICEIEPSVNRRVFLTYYPVLSADIESVTINGDPFSASGYRLDAKSGTLYNAGGWTETISITYTGGYELPGESPLALQQSSLLLAREAYMAAKRGDASVRMISHKESRIMYFDPNSGQAGGGGQIGFVGSATKKAVNDLLRHFMRFPV